MTVPESWVLAIVGVALFALVVTGVVVAVREEIRFNNQVKRWRKGDFS